MPNLRSARLRGALRRLFFTAVLCVTSLALLWTEENWRAARAWARCQRELAARGDVLTARGYPVPIPPGRNLALTPLLAGLFDYTVDPATGLASFAPGSGFTTRFPALENMPYLRANDLRDPGVPPPDPGMPNVYHDHDPSNDLPEWQAYFRRHAAESGLAPLAPGAALPPAGEDVLQGLERCRPVLDLFAHAADVMPDGVMGLTPFSYNGGRTPVRLAIRTLDLRACAFLAVGRVADARSDLDLILWLRTAMFHGLSSATSRGSPDLVSSMFGGVNAETVLPPLRDGLAARRWSADDLVHFQQALQGCNLLADYRDSASNDRVEMITLIDDYMRGKYRRDELFSVVPFSDQWSQWLAGRMVDDGPRGWQLLNKVNLCWFYQDYLLGSVDVPARRLRPDRQRAGEEALERAARSPVLPTKLLVCLGIPGYLLALNRVADAQTAVDEGVVACALERYALDHAASYPADLAALVPEYLDRVPAGVVDGVPLRYQPSPDGRYELSGRLTDHAPEYRAGASAVVAGRLVWRYPISK